MGKNDLPPGQFNDISWAPQLMRLLLLVLAFPVVYAYEKWRMTRIGPWSWGAILGLLNGVLECIAVYEQGRSLGASLLVGLGAATLIGIPVGMFFMWWLRSGRDWALGRGVKVRWPL
jgi:glucose-6-phosphate-specific signal transduction histidine kinase